VSETPSRPSNTSLAVLGLSSISITLLAIYQWFELIAIRSGKTAACSVNETVNCATVWNSAFASMVHENLGIPVAGLGIVFGGAGVFLTFILFSLSKKNMGFETWVNALKVLGAIGLLSVVTFISASFAAKAVCLTCLGTYVLTAIFGFGALKMLPGPTIPSLGKWPVSLAWSALFSVPIFLALLIPGHNTPKANLAEVLKPDEHAEGPQDVSAFFESLPENEKLTTAYARDIYMKAQTQDTSAFVTRQRVGPENAPVKIVEFTDILCGHCRQFEGVMEEIEKLVPPGIFSIEARQYPLDKDCNPEMPKSPGDGTRCMGARVQICLEGKPQFVAVRKALFENQSKLNKDNIIETAVTLGANREVLLACIAAEDTEQKLKQDLAYAKLHKIQGTPLVLLNGKEAPPAPAFIYGMIMAKGDVNAPYFLKLPPPPKE
jgi:protein-disulfide isomerase/uncharacterized membrane protein